jgi:hypothetical protein
MSQNLHADLPDGRQVQSIPLKIIDRIELKRPLDLSGSSVPWASGEIATFYEKIPGFQKIFRCKNEKYLRIEFAKTFNH